jgi:hypothetical protein
MAELGLGGYPGHPRTRASRILDLAPPGRPDVATLATKRTLLGCPVDTEEKRSSQRVQK